MDVASIWGLTVRLHKTKGMRINAEPGFVDGVPVCDQSMEIVKKFPYLGSTISDNGEVDCDVQIRIAKAARAFGCPKKSIFTNPYLSVAVKRVVYRAVVLATLLYGLAYQILCQIFHICITLLQKLLCKK